MKIITTHEKTEHIEVIKVEAHRFFFPTIHIRIAVTNKTKYILLRVVSGGTVYHHVTITKETAIHTIESLLKRECKMRAKNISKIISSICHYI